jgi:hypothetical protein
MTGERRSGGWRSETVLAAMVTGAAAVVVAIVGLLGGFGGGGDDGTTPTVSPDPEPTISIRETTFAAGGAGTVTIRVAGITSAFRSGDRLYAIARPPAVKRWWVSDPVVPLIGGDWVALIEASPNDGEQLTVSAVRIPAEDFGGAVPTVTTAPGTPPTPAASGPTETSPTSPPGGPSRGERIEAELRASGEDADSVEASSAPVTVVAPSR